MRFGQTIQNLNRLRHVIKILLKYGFEDVVASTPLHKLLPNQGRFSPKSKANPYGAATRWERMRMVVEELGATFIKLAQVLSNRPDLLPGPLIHEFQKLQSHVAPFPAAEARAIIELETGRKISEVFEYFDDEPLGAASIGQVHRARIKYGDDVVVKVQRPNVKKTVETDLELLKEFVKLTEGYFAKNGILNPLEIVQAFEKTMNQELDYLVEARNITQFRRFYASNKEFSVPKVYKKLSTKRVLTMELVSGCKITDVETMRSWGLEPSLIAEKGMAIYLTQIFEFGYFHADPHPGNIIIKSDGTICLIDFGMVGRLMQRDKLSFAGLFISMAQEDPKGMAMYFKRLSSYYDVDNEKAFEKDLSDLVEAYATLEVEETNMADVTSALQKIIYDYKLVIPGSVFLIMRALVILEGIGKTIHPSFQTLEFVKPYGAKMLAERFSPKNMAEDLYQGFTGALAFVNQFPAELQALVKKIKEGKLTLKIDHPGQERLIQAAEGISHKLFVTLLIAALLVASSISMTADLPPAARMAYGMPLIGLIELAAAGVLSLWLFLSMWGKRGK